MSEEEDVSQWVEDMSEHQLDPSGAMYAELRHELARLKIKCDALERENAELRTELKEYHEWEQRNHEDMKEFFRRGEDAG
jgi:hypothetical protein